MNIRMLCTSNVAHQVRVINGRQYSGVAGQEFDIIDADAAILSANGWTWVAPSGPTTARPTGTLGVYQATHGFKFFDTTLNKLIVFAAAAWRDPSTGAAV